MDHISLKLLRKIAKNGEISLQEALNIGKGRAKDHRDQYQLALLIEGEYLGYTLNHTPPEGAEKMREYSLAISLHMFTLPKGTDGTVEYLKIIGSGGVEPKNEKVFLKAKGALYLEEYDAKSKERLFALFLGVISAYLAAWFTAFFSK